MGGVVFVIFALSEEGRPEDGVLLSLKALAGGQDIVLRKSQHFDGGSSIFLELFHIPFLLYCAFW